MAILVGTRVSRMSLVYFFDYATVSGSTVTGWCVIASFILSSLAGAVYMPYLIERAKKCLDFSATLHIIHLFICIMYGGWPSSLTWWVVNGTGVAVMALLGEYLCIRRELQEIPIARYRSSKPLSFLLNIITCIFSYIYMNLYFQIISIGSFSESIADHAA
ncbi:coatomer subunit beta-2 [Actinidia rufa]|uniref:Coatomer subunit beta-2 n=1 Tax=Actinidia rufa TaxID=165716 RepID=A0A7J0FZP0_9ERIC|nr:coatomer subunit beta-2 [Actinidia rufa]